MNFLLPFLLLGGVPVAIFVYLAFIKKDKAQVVATEEIAVTVPAPAQADAKSDDEPKPVEVVVAVRLVKEVRGKILSTIATVMTILI